MSVVLDTSVQIARIFGSKDKKSRISEVIDNNACYCTVYVLGEFYATIINDYATMYAIIDQADDLNEAEKKVNEKAFYRSQSRMHKIFIFLRERYDNNLSDIQLYIKTVFDLLIHKFYKGIEKNLLSGSKCNRANAYIEYVEGCPIVQNLNCRKTDNHCDISTLWNNYYDIISKLADEHAVNEKIKRTIAATTASIPPKGNNCRSVGDCVICLEAIDENIDTVCTNNSTDFLPITKHLGLKLIVPQYSNK